MEIVFEIPVYTNSEQLSDEENVCNHVIGYRTFRTIDYSYHESCNAGPYVDTKEYNKNNSNNTKCLSYNSVILHYDNSKNIF